MAFFQFLLSPLSVPERPLLGSGRLVSSAALQLLHLFA
jgi:hypothetical protein